uniref:Uncharacterized protein n=1 Tax=Anguilla anguilla TaxID=7936 RepID=A0A0E9TIS8_ANGAN
MSTRNPNLNSEKPASQFVDLFSNFSLGCGVLDNSSAY